MGVARRAVGVRSGNKRAWRGVVCTHCRACRALDRVDASSGGAAAAGGCVAGEHQDARWRARADAAAAALAASASSAPRGLCISLARCGWRTAHAAQNARRASRMSSTPYLQHLSANIATLLWQRRRGVKAASDERGGGSGGQHAPRLRATLYASHRARARSIYASFRKRELQRAKAEGLS